MELMLLSLSKFTFVKLMLHNLCLPFQMDYPSGEKSAMMRSEVKKDDCHGWFRIAIVLFSVSIVLFFLVSLFGMLPEDVSAVPCGNACRSVVPEIPDSCECVLKCLSYLGLLLLEGWGGVGVRKITFCLLYLL